jgi:hypothetical protein
MPEPQLNSRKTHHLDRLFNHSLSSSMLQSMFEESVWRNSPQFRPKGHLPHPEKNQPMQAKTAANRSAVSKIFDKCRPWRRNPNSSMDPELTPLAFSLA